MDLHKVKIVSSMIILYHSTRFCCIPLCTMTSHKSYVFLAISISIQNRANGNWSQKGGFYNAFFGPQVSSGDSTNCDSFLLYSEPFPLRPRDPICYAVPQNGLAYASLHFVLRPQPCDTFSTINFAATYYAPTLGSASRWRGALVGAYRRVAICI